MQARRVPALSLIHIYPNLGNRVVRPPDAASNPDLAKSLRLLATAAVSGTLSSYRSGAADDFGSGEEGYQSTLLVHGCNAYIMHCLLYTSCYNEVRR